MQIDWFWLAVITFIIGMTISICVSNYFRYKSAVTVRRVGLGNNNTNKKDMKDGVQGQEDLR